MKKIMIGIVVAVVVLCAVGIGVFASLTNKNLEGENTPNNINTNETITNEVQDNKKENDNNDSNTNNETNSKKVLVVYYSATNNTKSVAEKMAENLNGDTFEIVPAEEYTQEDLNYSNQNARVFKEHDDESLRNIELKTAKIENWESYDTILIGYPIWWGVAAWPVDTFVKSNNFSGKTIIPFCTSASSELGQSGKLLESIASGGNWLEGKRFSSRPSDADIKAFTDTIK